MKAISGKRLPSVSTASSTPMDTNMGQPRCNRFEILSPT